MAGLDETLADPEVGQASDDVAYWLSQIKRAESDAEEWQKRCDRIRERYLFEEKTTARKRKYQMLWSNQEVLRPAVYARRPNPSVSSRFKDGDAVIRLAGQLLERTLDVQFDLGDYGHSFELVRNDFLLFAQGVPRIRYEAQIDELQVDDGAGEWEVDDTSDESKAEENPREVLKAEHVKVDFVHRKDFIFPVVRTWNELPWICFRSFMDRKELKRRWPDIGGKIPLDSKSTTYAETDKKKESSRPQATIYEIWDKKAGKVIWLAKQWEDLLEEPEEPYLKFENFWPCPRPAFGTLDTERMQSIPDYVYYQDQAEEINDLTARIASLTDSLKIVGFYPAGPEGEGYPEIEAALRPGFENKAIAVKSWATFTKAGGSQGVPFVFLPIKDVVETIKACIDIRKQLIDDVWQITGISDIMRGDTEAEETATAQGMKSNWGSARLKDKQNEMSRVCCDATRLVAEVIAGHFQIESMLESANMHLPTEQDVQAANQQYQQQLFQLQQQQQASPSSTPAGPPGGPSSSPAALPMLAGPQGQSPPQPGGGPQAGPPAPTQQQGPPQGGSSDSGSQQRQPPDLGPTQEQVLSLMRDGVLRRFLIDIETDSTVLLDEKAEQAARTEIIEKIGRFIVAMLPVGQQQPVMLPFLGELLLFGVRAFPAARELEEKAEKMIELMEQQAGQPQQPDPHMQLEQMKAQAEMARAHIDQQMTLLKAQAEGQKAKLELEQAQQAHMTEIERTRMEMAQAQQAHQLTQAEHGLKMKTLTQQVEMDERKMAAQQAMDLFKDNSERQRIEMQRQERQEASQAARAQQQANNVVPMTSPTRKRKFAIRRGPDGLAAGFEEMD